MFGYLRPILLFAASYYAGYLVVQGEIQQVCHNDVVHALVTGLGYGIIGFTSVASIWHAFVHPHPKVVQGPVVVPPPATPVKTQPVSQLVPTDDDPGTPPSTN